MRKEKGIFVKRIKTDGFTLIELLVVISIIALLLSILMPALNKVRMQAQLVTCLSNEKQISLAVLMYSNDYKDTLPDATTFYGWTRPIGYDNGWGGSWEADQWWTHFSPYFQNKKGEFGPGKLPSLLKCRSDKVFAVTNQYSSYITRKAVDVYGCQAAPVKITKFYKPSGTVYLLERYSHHDNPLLWWSFSTATIKRKMNVMFIDGHVTTIKWTYYGDSIYFRQPTVSTDPSRGWNITANWDY